MFIASKSSSLFDKIDKPLHPDLFDENILEEDCEPAPIEIAEEIL